MTQFSTQSTGENTDDHLAHLPGQFVHEAEQLALVAKHTHNAVIITDKDGFTTWVNEAFTKISGFSAAEIIGKRPGRVLQGKATDHAVVYRISEMLKKGLRFDEEIVNYHKNGSAYWISLNVEPIFDVAGKISQFIAIETDITVQKKLEEELKNAHSLMESAARIAGVGAWQVDLISNDIIWSDQTKKIHEVDLDFSPTLETAISFYLPEVREQLSKSIQDTIETKKSWEFELPMLTAKQNHIWVKSIGEAVVENGQVVKLIGTFQDVTQRRLIDKIQLEFISTVSHELRTPLTSIRGALGLLVSNVAGELPEKVQTLVSVAHRNSVRLIELVNDILDMNKLAAGALKLDSKDQDLLPVIHQSIEATNAYAKQYKVQIFLQSNIDCALVKIDQGRMIQVMVNLISNACKFSNETGRVDIHLFERESDYVVEVTDHGIGIALDFFPRIFAQFAQADGSNTRQQGGTGLGLNISKTLMEKMNGEIGFRSVEGTGSTFWISLPVQQIRC
jgi:two-component system sensor histidine kinase/response regulator